MVGTNYRVVRNKSEIDELIGQCVEQDTEGGSRYPGMTYEEGVQYAIRWLTDLAEPHPINE